MMNFIRKHIALFLTAVLLLGMVTPAFAADRTRPKNDCTDRYNTAEKSTVLSLPPEGTYVEGELLVKIEQTVTLQSSEDVFGDYVQDCSFLFSLADEKDKVTLQGVESESVSWYCLTLKKDADFLQVWDDLRQLDNVIAVEPNYIRTVQKTTDDIVMQDPYIHTQRWLDQIHAVDAWDNGKHIGSNIVVAVVDSGVDLDHPDLVGNLLPGYDFYDKDDEPDDVTGHGTHVAGIIAACGNEIGVRGVAYGAKILPVRVMGNNGGSISVIINGIKYAADQGADIINMSLGGFGYSSAEEDAIHYAKEKGCLVVASAGNETLPTRLSEGETYGGVKKSPACCLGVLSVMAADQDDTLAPFSNYDTDIGEGDEYEIMAPGVGILSTYKDGKYKYMSGTSMATPVTSGAAAVLMGMGCDAETAFSIISSCTKKPAGRVDESYPFLNLQECLEKVSNADAYRIAPNVTECSLTTNLPDMDFGHGAVRMGGLNIDTRVYFYNGEFQSKLMVNMANIGGSGDVTLTGSVGGRDIIPQTVDIRFGEKKSVDITPSTTPTVDKDGTFAVTLYVNGKQILSEKCAAFDLKTFDEKYYDSKNNRYLITDTGVTLTGSSTINTVWVVDRPLIILGKTFTVQREKQDMRVVLYEGVGCEDSRICNIQMGKTTFTQKDVELRGYAGFGLRNKNMGEIIIEGCDLYDPSIDFVNRLYDSSINRVKQSISITGDLIEECGFINCENMTVNCREFQHNLINRCGGKNATIVVSELAQYNTFVDNFFRSGSGYILRVYAPDYKEGKGFCFNNVIGPLQVLRNDGSAEYAEVYDVYYQKVSGSKASPLASGDEDKLYCSDTSVFSSDLSDLERWGFASDSPAFVTGVTCSRYLLNEQGWIDYTVDVAFSTPVDGALADSTSDPLIVSAQTSLSDDGTVLTIQGSTVENGESMTNYYSAYGCRAKDRGYHTCLWGQTTYAWPIAFGDHYYNTKLKEITVTGDSEVRTVTWNDERLLDGYTAEIIRSINGGEEETIADGITGNSYEDRFAISEGSLLEYRVSLSKDGKHPYRGECTFLVDLPQEEKGVLLDTEDLTGAKGNTIAVSMNSKNRINGSMTFFFPELQISSIAFSDAVKNLHIIYGVMSDKSGTTVCLGVDDDAILDGGESLFTLTVCAANGVKTVAVTNGGEEEQWGKSEKLHYWVLDGVGSAMQKSDNGELQICKDQNGEILVASYDQNGKLLDLESLVQGTYRIEAKDKEMKKVFFLDAYKVSRESILLQIQE